MRNALLDGQSRANAAKAYAARKMDGGKLLHACSAAQVGSSNKSRFQRCRSPSSGRAAAITNQTSSCPETSRSFRTSPFVPEVDCGQILLDDVVPSPTKDLPPRSTARTVSDPHTHWAFGFHRVDSKSWASPTKTRITDQNFCRHDPFQQTRLRLNTIATVEDIDLQAFEREIYTRRTMISARESVAYGRSSTLEELFFAV